MSAHDDVERTSHALVQVLGRIEAALQRHTRCCHHCGCLLIRGENCPNCALTQIRRAS